MARTAEMNIVAILILFVGIFYLISGLIQNDGFYILRGFLLAILAAVLKLCI